MMDHQEFITGWVEVWFGPGSGGLISHLPHALDHWDYTQEEYSKAQGPLFLEWKQPKDDAAREALSLLSSAGFTRDNPLRFEQNGIPGTWEPAMAQLMQAQWNRLSQGVVQSDLRLVDNATLRTRQSRGEFDVAGPVGRGTVIDPDQIRQYYHTAGGNNFGKYSDPRLDQMFEKERAIFDTAQRKPAVKEIVTYLIQNAPYVGPTWRDQLTAAHPKVKNFVAENVNTISGFLYETVWLDV
jgi:ABC-type transport system substrate-binding protein